MKIQDASYRGSDKIQGDWKLDSIILQNQLFIPEEKSYFLHVYDSTVKFNTTTNQCFYEMNLSNDSLRIKRNIICTKVGSDTDGDKLNYYGAYNVMDSLNLVIRNEFGTYYMTRYIVKKER